MLRKLIFGALAALTVAAPAIAGDRGHDGSRYHGEYQQHAQRYSDRYHRPARPAHIPPAAGHHAPAFSHHAPGPRHGGHAARIPHDVPAAHAGISIGLDLPL